MASEHPLQTHRAAGNRERERGGGYHKLVTYSGKCKVTRRGFPDGMGFPNNN